MSNYDVSNLNEVCIGRNLPELLKKSVLSISEDAYAFYHLFYLQCYINNSHLEEQVDYNSSAQVHSSVLEIFAIFNFQGYSPKRETKLLLSSKT